MGTEKQLVIGLFGFGVVGEGLYKVLQQTPSLKAYIKKVCIKNAEKERNAPLSLFTTDKNELLNDGEINVIVEVIDDADAAFEIVSAAMYNNKAVVSASKKMIAEHLTEILQLQRATGQSFLYESAVCASIPVIRNLEEYYDNDLLHGIRAIVNGSTNFILTKIFEEQLQFSKALHLAQQLGFAESNPVLDVEGYDAVNKWCILLNHAYGIVQKPSDILFTGIQNIQLFDAVVAQQKNYEIKLVAQARKLANGKVAAFVLPQFVRHDDPLAFVKNEYNGAVIESGFADRQFFYGKGAGSFPTASAVLSDIAALRYDYRYEYKKLYHHLPGTITTDFYVNIYLSLGENNLLPEHEFEIIEKHEGQGGKQYITGIIHFTKLINNSFWQQPGNSLILLPDAIRETSEIRSVKKYTIENTPAFQD